LSRVRISERRLEVFIGAATDGGLVSSGANTDEVIE
jgi:hypothetical protein